MSQVALVHPAQRVSEDAGSNWKSGVADYEYNRTSVRSDTAGVSSGANTQGAASIVLSGGNMGNAAGEGASGYVRCHALSSTSYHHFDGEFGYMDSAGTSVQVSARFGAVYNGTTNAINGVRFLFDSGNIASGTITLYGLRK